MLRMTAETVYQSELRESILQWERDCGIEPSHTYKILIDTDAMMATVFQYKANDGGQLYYDRDTDDVAILEPWKVKISALPPGGFQGVF